MLKNGNLCPLDNESEARQAIVMGINNTLNVYIINENNSLPQLLTPGDLGKIRSSIPNKVKLLSRSERSASNPFQEVCFLDLWIEKARYVDMFQNKPNILSEEIKAYSTPHMELMYKAIDEFWLNADLNNPPKQDVIIPWIQV